MVRDNEDIIDMPKTYRLKIIETNGKAYTAEIEPSYYMEKIVKRYGRDKKIGNNYRKVRLDKEALESLDIGYNPETSIKKGYEFEINFRTIEDFIKGDLIPFRRDRKKKSTEEQASKKTNSIDDEIDLSVFDADGEISGTGIADLLMKDDDKDED